jgi:S1-C subfamily serine protease
MRFADFVTRSTVKVNVGRENPATAEVGYYHGAGVVIDSRHILTAHHVIKLAKIIFVNFRRIEGHAGADDAINHSVEVVAIAPDLDMAVLELKYDEVELPRPMRISAFAPAVGEHVSNFSDASVWTWGTISRQGVRAGDVYGLTETTASCRPGDSGGPVVNGNGELIGVISMYKIGVFYCYFTPIETILERFRDQLT